MIVFSTFQISIHFNTQVQQVQLCAQILGSALRSRLLNAFVWIALQQFLRRVVICVERNVSSVARPLAGSWDRRWCLGGERLCVQLANGGTSGKLFLDILFFSKRQYCKNLLMLTSEGKPMRRPSKWVMLCRILPRCTWRTTKMCHLLLSALSYYIHLPPD